MSGVNSWAEFRRLRNEYIQNCRNTEKKYESLRLSKLNNRSFSLKKVLAIKQICIGVSTLT